MLNYAYGLEDDCVDLRQLESLPHEEKINLPAKLRHKLIKSFMSCNEVRSSVHETEACRPMTQLVMGRMGPFLHVDQRVALQHCLQDIPLPGYPEDESMIIEGIARTDNFEYPDNPLPLATHMKPYYRGKLNVSLKNAIQWVEVPSRNLKGFYKVRRTNSDIANEFKKKRKFKKVVKIDKWQPRRQPSLARPSEDELSGSPKDKKLDGSLEDSLFCSQERSIQFGKIEILDSAGPESIESCVIPEVNPPQVEPEIQITKKSSILRVYVSRSPEDRPDTDEVWEDILPPRDYRAYLEEPVPDQKLWVAQPLSREILPRGIVVWMNDEIPTLSEIRLANWDSSDESSEEDTIDVSAKRSRDATPSALHGAARSSSLKILPNDKSEAQASEQSLKSHTVIKPILKRVPNKIH